MTAGVGPSAGTSEPESGLGFGTSHRRFSAATADSGPLGAGEGTSGEAGTGSTEVSGTERGSPGTSVPLVQAPSSEPEDDRHHGGAEPHPRLGTNTLATARAADTSERALEIHKQAYRPQGAER